MDAAVVIQSRLLGAVLVRKGLITAEQLEHALEVQKETGDLLGEIVVGQFGVPRLEIATILAELWERPTGNAPAGAEQMLNARFEEVAAASLREDAPGRGSLEQTLNGRVEEFSAASVPEGKHDEIHARPDAIEAVHVADGLVVGKRPDGIEATVEAIGGQPEPITGCVAYVPTGSGYRFVELPGPSPDVGSLLKLAEGEFVVIGRGHSPLPLDHRPCAYLERAGGEGVRSTKEVDGTAGAASGVEVVTHL